MLYCTIKKCCTHKMYYNNYYNYYYYTFIRPGYVASGKSQQATGSE